MVKRLTREEQRAATRRALIDAAAASFAERGFDASSIEEIAERAGYSRGAFYSNFAGKEACFFEVLRARGGDQLSAVAAVFAGPEPLAIRLDRGGRLLAERIAHDREWCRLYMEAWALASRRPDLREAFAAEYRERREYLAGMIRSELGARQVPGDESLLLLAGALIALVEGYILQELIDEEGLPEQFLARTLQLLVTPLAASLADAGEQA